MTLKTALITGLLTAITSFAATTKQEDLAKVEAKWAQRDAKDALRKVQAREKAEFSRNQKIKMLELQLGTVVKRK